MIKIYKNPAITAATEFDVSVHLEDFTVQASPNGGTTGTVSIEAKVPGSSTYSTIATAINLFSGSQISKFNVVGNFSSVRVTPVGFDGTSVDVTVVGSD